MNIPHHIRKNWFYLWNRSVFRKLPYNACIDKPLKLQGKKFIELEERTYIHKYGWIGCYKIDGLPDPYLKIGRDTCIGNFCHISCSGNMILEPDVLIADKVTIADTTHEYRNIDIPIGKQPYGLLREVSIGEGTWVADNCCIIGAKIGKHCVIGAGSVVTGDIPDYSVAVGVPAKVVKKYNFETNTWEKI